MKSFATDDHVVVKLEPDDQALEAIRRACDDHDIDTGAVVSGIGTFKNLEIHYVHTTDFPEDQAERNTTLSLDGAWEITNIQGIVADSDPHLHVTAFDGERTVGGHLEEGCTVHLLGEVLIEHVPGLELTRRPEEKNVSRLQRR